MRYFAFFQYVCSVFRLETGNGLLFEDQAARENVSIGAGRKFGKFATQ